MTGGGAPEVVLVKADGDAAGDRTYLVTAGGGRRVAVHPVHDLPHLVVESCLGIGDGLWAELAAGQHAGAARAATARHPARRRHGRIVSGAATGQPTDAWLTAGHRRAKAVTNAVANRAGDGPDTPAGVRDRLAAHDDPDLARLLAAVADDRLALAVAAVRGVERRWAALGAGGRLRLAWPLSDGQLAGLAGGR